MQQHNENDGNGRAEGESPPGVTLPRSCRIDLPGRGGVRLFVGWPDTPPPPEGWPTLWVLDGNRNFPLALFSARTQALRPALTHVVPALVVGLGYADGADGADETAARTLRLRDYTPPDPSARLRPRPDGRPWTETGGAPAFLDRLAGEIMPLIAGRYPVNPARQALFGHSMGGLFTLYAAFTAPELFRSYLVSSPSIWFRERAILEHEAGFAGRLAALGERRDMMISVGALEQHVPPDRIAAVGAAYVGWVAANRMVDNAAELGARLAGLAGRGLDLSRFVFAQETHITAPPVALGQGLRIALRPPPEPEPKPESEIA